MPIRALWNVGAKVTNLEADVDFFRVLGATVRLREVLERRDQAVQYALLDWAGTRLYLTPEPMFEQQLPRALGAGLTHIVVEVDSIGELVDIAVNAGAVVRVAPEIVEGGFGKRGIAFVESPGGVIIEFIRIMKDGLATSVKLSAG